MATNTTSRLIQSMIIRQGDIYLVDLNPVKGHEQAGLRPALVVQNDILNENLSTVVIAPITSNLKAKGKLTTSFLSKNTSHLNQDSVALLFQIRTIDKGRLGKKIVRLNREEFIRIKEQLRFVF